MMKNTKILFGLLAIFIAAITTNSCTRCPACPEESNIVIHDGDTVSFKIVTHDGDTVSFKMAAPSVTRAGKIEKASIVIDNVDMTRMIMENVDTTNYNIEVRPGEAADTIQQKK